MRGAPPGGGGGGGGRVAKRPGPAACPLDAAFEGGIVRLPDEEDSTYVRTAPAGVLDPAHELVFDWRDGDVLQQSPQVSPV